MNRFALLIAIALLFAHAAFAQDDGGDSADDDSVFSGDAFSGGGASGPRVDPLVDLRSWLNKASAAPLDAKQEKALNKVYDKEVKAMAKSFEKRFGISLESAVAAQGSPRGRRGAGFSRTTPEEAAEIRRLSAQLVDKVIAALRMDQQAALRRFQSEQIRGTRLNLLTSNMELAGVPLAPAQKSQIEDLFVRESRLRTLMIIEAKGQPYATKVSQLEAQTTQRIVKLLEQNQKNVLAEAMTRSKTR